MCFRIFKPGDNQPVFTGDQKTRAHEVKRENKVSQLSDLSKLTLKKTSDLYKARRKSCGLKDRENSQAGAQEPLAINAISARISLSKEPVDTLAICRAHPEFFVYGTYALVNPDKGEDEHSARKGTIQVLPVSTKFKPVFAGELPPQLASYAWSSAVVDIHFHPRDSTLLGVATSKAEIYFFRFVKRGDVLKRCVITELLPVGKVVVEEDTEDGAASLVTHFKWVPHIRSTGVREVDNVWHVVLVCALASHKVKLIKTEIPGIAGRGDHRLNDEVPRLPVIEAEIQTHDQEAWFVELLRTYKTNNTLEYLIFSGGDDSKWIASLIEIDLKVNAETLLLRDPIPLWSDTKTHQAGITSVLVLPRHFVADATGDQSIYSSEFRPVLTGSYDDSLRIWCLDNNAPNHKRSLQYEYQTEGGVWRLLLLNTYQTIEKIREKFDLNLTEQNAVAEDQADSEPNPVQQSITDFIELKTNYIILVANMWKHAKIIRVTFLHSREAKELPPEAEPEWRARAQAFEQDRSASGGTGWNVRTEAIFSNPHESLVYAVDAVRQEKRADVFGQWDMKDRYTVVTGSFYDHKICTWEYEDHREDCVEPK